MYQEDHLPADYQPFEELVVCGNRLLNVQVPISVDGLVPLLVGKGTPPKVWLTMFTSTGLRPIVRAGVSLHDEVRIETSQQNVSRVLVKSDVVLEIQQKSEQLAEITKLDLRLLGLEIFGNTLGLYVGSHSFIGNVFRNLRTMIGIGPKSEQASSR